MLATLIDLAARGLPLLAAGDLNEAVAHDLDPRTGTAGTWGREYFQRLAAAGLAEHLSTAWGGERATRGDLQLDHVVVDAAGRALLRNGAPVRDAAWDSPEAAGRLSDHRAVWVPLAPDAWSPT